jgi:hypothetical protein
MAWFPTFPSSRDYPTFAVMNVYVKEHATYKGLYEQYKRRFNTLSLIRLFAAIATLSAGWYFYKTGHPVAFFICLAGIISFFALISYHARLAAQKRFYAQLEQINRYEMEALAGNFTHFDPGNKYLSTDHAYSFDLDIFGPNSLYQYLNRTANAIGSDRLAQYFLQAPPTVEIPEIQSAIQELAPKLAWRQHFLATGQLNADPHAAYQKLLLWANSPKQAFSLAQKGLIYSLTGISLIALVGMFVQSDLFAPLFKWLLVVNLMVVAAHTNRIKSTLSYLNEMYKIVSQYGYLIQIIEKESFKSVRLQKIQEKLSTDHQGAGAAILRLSNILHQLESVQNLFGALVFNSLGLYHLHMLLLLERWEKRYALHIQAWIEAAGEMEALCSLAHFAGNNPDFVYPVLSEKPEIKVENMGHPLIPAAKRVPNSLSFDQAGFVILTGSNMSGKSTFLRTIGINLILAKAGAPVCASAFQFYPFDVFVCMKLSDSLHDNESYFYAELKRLRGIIDQLETGRPGFVLLDEVLRGTNSNDKLSGTLGLVETMIRQKATGLIATHDLNVCDLTHKYPDYLRNMCFEVEMTADNLVFDYRLRAGICVNKSASFLMKKMKVIQ